MHDLNTSRLWPPPPTLIFDTHSHSQSEKEKTQDKTSLEHFYNHLSALPYTPPRAKETKNQILRTHQNILFIPLPHHQFLINKKTIREGKADTVQDCHHLSWKSFDFQWKSWYRNVRFILEPPKIPPML
ncbi:hypothetical protein L873DRAFT_1808127, partial [Choiromyces venosus 120613-1]